MKKRVIVRLISYSLALSVVSAAFAIKSEVKCNKYRLEIKNSYSKCVDDLSTGLNNISLTLKKAEYVSTPKQISSMAAKLLTEAEFSKNALSQIPQNDRLSSVNKFLSQVGNYALAVSKNLITTGKVTKKEKEDISALSNTASKVANIINNAEVSYEDTAEWVDKIDSQVDFVADESGIGGFLSEIEDSFDDYPTLVYDGPYSEHILTKEAALLQNADVLTEKEALKIAAMTANRAENTLGSDGRIFGNISSYRFAGEGVSVSVSVQGGYPVYMRKDRVVSETILSHEQALEKAKRHLKNLSLNGFVETYYFTSEGVCVISFAYLDGETICYTDLIKVGVALDNGEIMFLETSGYISNHTDRAFETPKYTAKEAGEVLSDNLEVQKTALALIPVSSTEKRCYEFTCKANDGTEILVYIDTGTLEEQEVLILLKSDGGTLAK